MKISLLVLFLLITISCKKQIDDSGINISCTDSCTVLQGRFITGNNEGIGNIAVELNSEIKPFLGFGGKVRKIAVGKTDLDGNYLFKFKLNKDEYGVNPRANLRLNFKYDQEKYLSISWYKLFGTRETVGPFLKRDTSMIANIYLNSKGTIKVKLTGFRPLLSGDNFSVATSCKAGLDKQQSSDSYMINANEETTEGVISACGNEMSKLYIIRKKNGIESISDTTVSTPINNTPAVEFTF